MCGRESDREHPARGFPQQMNVLQIKRVTESGKITHESIKRPRIVCPRIARSAMPTQIASHHAVVAGKHRYPLAPELRRPPKSVLDQNCLPRLPRFGEVVVLIERDI